MKNGTAIRGNEFAPDTDVWVNVSRGSVVQKIIESSVDIPIA
jgi:hypothetical protein